jgi:hypothetical protein
MPDRESKYHLLLLPLSVSNKEEATAGSSLTLAKCIFLDVALYMEDGITGSNHSETLK